MKFGWENDKERLKRWMKISPKKKMEWLQEMHDLMRKHTSIRQWKRMQKLREKF